MAIAGIPVQTMITALHRAYTLLTSARVGAVFIQNSYLPV
jgi:hypothetical protein